MAKSKTGETKGVRCDGEKIRVLRKEKGLTQEALAEKARLTPRTLQRAEGGERVMPNFLKDIAHALAVEPSELAMESHGGAKPTKLSSQREQVRLKHVDSAREIKRLLFQQEKPWFEFDLDTDEELAETIAQTIEAIEAVQARPGWDPEDDQGAAPAISEIRALGRLNTLVNALNANEVFIYIGTYRQRSLQDYSNIAQAAPGHAKGKISVDSESVAIVCFSDKQVKQISKEMYAGATYEEMAVVLTRATSEPGMQFGDFDFYSFGALLDLGFDWAKETDKKEGKVVDEISP